MKRNIVGIISDTHDNRKNIEKAVEVFNQKEVRLVIHAGDFVSPFTVLDFRNLKCPMEMVYGNNDGEKVGLYSAFKKLGDLLPGPRTFSFDGKRFVLMHEHGCLDEVRTSESTDVIIYGHTHDVDIRKGHPLIINPGEAGGWLRGKATIATLDLDTMEVELIELHS